MIVLDTHIWIWWLSNPDNLSEAAQERLRAAIERREVAISSISAWEIAMLVEKGRLSFNMDVRDWIRKSEALPFIQFIPVDNTIALRSLDLPGEFHQDPVDRIIIATTLTTGSHLITKDLKIQDYPHVETVW